MFNQYQSALRHPRSMAALLLACLWLFAATCQAADPAWQGVWSGTIGKANVSVCLSENGPSEYRYQRYQKDIPLTRKDNQWQEAADGTITGIWTLDNPQGDTLEGTWQSPKTRRSLPIHLGRVADVGNEPACESQAHPQRGETAVTQTEFVSNSGAQATKLSGNLVATTQDGNRKQTFHFEKLSGGSFTSVVESRDGKALVAVGNMGEIARSTDDGASWVEMNSTAENTTGFKSVIGVSGGVLLATGYDVWRSTDDGINWSKVPNGFVDVGPDGCSILGLSGSTLVRSNDGGASWDLVKNCEKYKLSRVVAISKNTLVAVGDGGVIMRSTDGGVNWSLKWSGTRNVLLDLIVDSRGILVAVGEGGAIVRSTNAGAKWVVTNSETKNDLYRVIVGSNGTLVAVGKQGVIVHSIDEGATWIKENSGTKRNLKGIAIGQSGILIAVGDVGTVVQSADNGASWSVMQSGTSNTLNNVIATYRGSFVVVGDGDTILRSSDNGLRWIEVKRGVANDLNNIIVTPEGTMFAVGAAGTIVRLTDDGRRWSEVKGGTTNTLNSIVVGSKGVLVAVGDDGSIVRSADGGNSWSMANSRTTQHLKKIIVSRRGKLVAVGDRVAYSDDDGTTWGVSNVGRGIHLLDVVQVSEKVLVAVGCEERRYDSLGVILRSTDEGVHWVAVAKSEKMLGFNSVIVDHNGNIVVVGSSNGAETTVVLRSVDGGVNWSEAESATQLDLYSIVVSGGVLVAVGGGVTQYNRASGMMNSDGFGYTIVRSIDGGLSWSEVQHGAEGQQYEFTNVAVEPDGTLMAVGYSGNVAYSTNDGATWTALDSGARSYLSSVAFEPDGTLVAVGDNGVIIRGGPFPRK